MKSTDGLQERKMFTRFSHKFSIAVCEPAPSMSKRTYGFDGTYQECVDKAHEIYQECGRGVSVTGAGTYVLHRIARNGDIWERNTNSGVTFQTYNDTPVKLI